MPRIVEKIRQFLKDIESKHSPPEVFTCSFKIYNPAQLEGFENYSTDKFGLGRISFNEGLLTGVKNWWSFHYQPDGRGIYLMFPVRLYPYDKTWDKFVDYGIKVYLVGDTGERDLGNGYSVEFCYLKYYFVDIDQDAWTSAVMTLKVEITMKRVPKRRGEEIYVELPEDIYELANAEEGLGLTTRSPCEDIQEELPVPGRPSPGMISTEKYFMSFYLSDFSIKCHTRVFPAHRIILFEKCPVFAKRYCVRDVDDRGSGDNFSTGSQIEIFDLEPLVIEEFLRYIYTGTVEQMQVVGFELYGMAVVYEMHDLMEMCINQMAEHMTGANALNMYVFAREFNIPRLIQRASEVFYGCASNWTEVKAKPVDYAYYSEAESEDEDFDGILNEDKPISAAHAGDIDDDPCSKLSDSDTYVVNSDDDEEVSVGSESESEQE